MKYLYFLLTFFLTINLSAQTGVFTTYQNYSNGELKQMDELKINQEIIMSVSKITTLKFTKDGQNINYKPNEIWGFMYQGNLFRCSNNDFFFIAEKGKVILYSNGWAAYDQIRRKSEYGTVYGKDFYFMSNDLMSLIYNMPFGNEKHKPTIAQKLRYRDFMKNYPQHKELYDCINGSTDYHTADFCIEQYNERAK